MSAALYVNPTQAPPNPARRSFLRLVLTLLVLGVAVVGVILWLLKAPAAQANKRPVESSGTTWKAEQIYPPAPQAPKVTPAVKVEKTDDDRWRQQDAFNKQVLEALKARPKETPPAPPAKPVEGKKPVRYAAPMFLDNKLADAPAVSRDPEYLLGVGSYLPCVVETAINSDVEGHFVANVTQMVWDTATGTHPLVPPGSKILGNTQSNKLVFGSERLDTVSLKLRLPNGTDVPLKNAPVTDEQGVMGLTGEIDRHLLRIYGAVFLTGVLKGGTAAMQGALAGATGANQVAVSVAGTGAQATQRVAGPLLDTRPTITIASGQPCQVILLEQLTLPAVWQGAASLPAKGR